MPVDVVFSWLLHDVGHEYCWSVRQAQPDALATLPDAALEQLAAQALAGLGPAAGGGGAGTGAPRALSAAAAGACGGRAFCTRADRSSPHAVSFVAEPAEAVAAAAAAAAAEAVAAKVAAAAAMSAQSGAASASAPASSPSSSSSAAAAGSAAPAACVPGSVRVSLSEWSFPSSNFSILARLAMDDDAWVWAARAAAAAEHVEGAERPPNSGVQVAHRDIVPGRVNFTESARDAPTYWAWANDTHWMRQAVLKLFGETLVAVQARYYPEFRPMLEEFVAARRPAALPPHEEWTLVHWHPGWMRDDIELVRRGSIGISPPLTSYVLTDRPPANVLHALLGDTWGSEWRGIGGGLRRSRGDTAPSRSVAPADPGPPTPPRPQTLPPALSTPNPQYPPTPTPPSPRPAQRFSSCCWRC